MNELDEGRDEGSRTRAMRAGTRRFHLLPGSLDRPLTDSLCCFGGTTSGLELSGKGGNVSSLPGQTRRLDETTMVT